MNLLVKLLWGCGILQLDIFVGLWNSPVAHFCGVVEFSSNTLLWGCGIFRLDIIVGLWNFRVDHFCEVVELSGRTLLWRYFPFSWNKLIMV